MNLTRIFGGLLVAGVVGCAAQSANPESTEVLGVQSSALGENGTVVANGKCLDVQWGNSANGTPVWLYHCSTPPVAASIWHLTAANEIRITNLGDKCLMAYPFNGGLAYISDCSGVDTQKWYLNQDGTIRFGADPSFCLDIQGNGTADKTPVQIWTCNTSSAQQWNFQSWSDRLNEGQSLPTGQELRSANGTYRLIMQSDCNLVMYAGTTPVWWSGTYGQGTGCHADMQTDGNFVIYDAAHNQKWSTSTYGYGSASITGSLTWLSLQNDGNLVLYKYMHSYTPSSWALWASQGGRKPNPPCGTWAQTYCSCNAPNRTCTEQEVCSGAYRYNWPEGTCY